MNSIRSQAYGRVMETLRAVGPTKLQPAEAERIREAADALLFCDDLDAAPAARAALEDVTALTRDLVESGRWLPETADLLLEDLGACGPSVAARL
jgi:hypothetical protein